MKELDNNLNPRNYVVTVDEEGNETGLVEKMEAHVSGVLHRAISVFIFNSKREWLLQQRALHKYHCAGQWSNTCCSHPVQGETTLNAAERRLREEMGMQVHLIPVFSFIYKAELENGLIEHEMDHVFIGYSDELPEINPEEVSDYRYINQDSLLHEIDSKPEHFTPWFKLLVPKLIKQQGSGSPSYKNKFGDP